MQKIVSLCKRRGFVYQSSEIYGGLRSSYDYGPMGVELKRNLMNEWWRAMVRSREDIVGLAASIVMHPQVWRSSAPGHSLEKLLWLRLSRPAPTDSRSLAGWLICSLCRWQT